MIIIEPLGGLCNRLRALDSAISLSQETGRELHVQWKMNSKCNCKFSDLFNVPEVIVFLSQRNYGLSEKLKRRARPFFYSIGSKCYLDNNAIGQLCTRQDILTRLQSTDIAYIRTLSRFFKSDLIEPFSHFQPISTIADRVRSYAPDNLVGVHVRRTDHAPSTEHSPLQEFVRLMNEEIEKDKNVRFFVATDDPNTEAEMRKIFASRVITHQKKSYSRTDPAGMRDAAIDLYCLAGCRKLIGSYASSFSRTAAEIGGIDSLVALAR